MSEATQTPKFCRVVALDGFRAIVIGVGNLLTPGHIYQIEEIAGELMTRDLGEHAKPDQYSGHTVEGLFADGTVFHTLAEAQK